MKHLILSFFVLLALSTYAEAIDNDVGKKSTELSKQGQCQDLSLDHTATFSNDQTDAIIRQLVMVNPLDYQMNPKCVDRTVVSLFSNNQMLSCLMSRQEVNFSNSVTINTGVCNELICKEAILSSVDQVGVISFQTEADIANIAFNLNSNDAIVIDSNQKNSSEVERSPFVSTDTNC